MDRAPVDSSLIAAVGYESELLELEIELHDGHLYRYSDVSEFVYRKLLASESLGAFYNEQIRDRYPWVRLR